MGRPAVKPATPGTEAALPAPAPATAAEAKARKALEKRNEELEHLRADLIGGREYNRDVLLEESRIHYQNAASSFMQFGKLMLVIKEHEAENFWPFLKSKGLTDQADHRFIMKALQAAGKFCIGVPYDKQQRVAELGKSKMLELVVLDDAEIKQLADGGTVAGLDLDDVDRMSCTELRKALRKTSTKLAQEKETHERMLADKNAKLDQLDREVRRHHKLTPEEKAAADEELETDILEQLEAASSAFLVEVSTLQKTVRAAISQAPNEATTERVTQTVRWLFGRIAEITTENGIEVDFANIVTPDWITSGKGRGK